MEGRAHAQLAQALGALELQRVQCGARDAQCDHLCAACGVGIGLGLGVGLGLG